MLIVGATVAGSRFKELFRGWDIYYITAVRLVLMPLIAFAALKILAFRKC